MPKNMKPSMGVASLVGFAVAGVAIVGGIVQAIQGRDAPGLKVALGGLVSLVSTQGGRYAQAVALARRAADEVSPWVSAIDAALHAVPEGKVMIPADQLVGVVRQPAVPSVSADAPMSDVEPEGFTLSGERDRETEAAAGGIEARSDTEWTFIRPAEDARSVDIPDDAAVDEPKVER